jgi:ferric-dicitrate binding protein FerR (iron transport regulator)
MMNRDNKYDSVADYLQENNSDTKPVAVEKQRRGDDADPRISDMAAWIRDVWDALEPDKQIVSRIKARTISKISTHKKHSYITRISRYAAVVAIMLVAGGAGAFLVEYFTGRNTLPTAEKLISIKAPMGSRTEVALPDGTTVWLNSGSRLDYRVDFHDYRYVVLSGEAFFEVARMEKIPFLVKTNIFNITVLGTSFNVRAYPGERSSQVFLTEGSIRLQSEKYGLSDTMLSPMEKAVFGGAANPDGFEILHNVNPRESLGWRDGRLIFNGERLRDLADKMERWYNVDIEIPNEKLAEERITGEFAGESIEQALGALQRSLSFTYTKRDNLIYIQ